MMAPHCPAIRCEPAAKRSQQTAAECKSDVVKRTGSRQIGRMSDAFRFPHRFEPTPLSKIRSELASMSSKELMALHAEVVEAIKAAIRAKRLASLPQPKGAEAPAPVKSVGDLERERDEWLAKRGRKS